MSKTIELPTDCVVTLDLDDTLCRERDFVASGFLTVARALGVDRPEDYCRWMMSRRDAGEEVLQAAIERAANAGASSGKLGVADALQIYRSHEPEISLRDDAERLLDRCAEAGVTLALITDGRSETQRNKLVALGILGRFDPLCISEEIGAAKPDPASFRQVMDAHKRRSYVFIADNPRKDFIAPNALGWHTICLRDDGQNIHAQDIAGVEEQDRPHDVVDSLDEIHFQSA